MDAVVSREAYIQIVFLPDIRSSMDGGVQDVDKEVSYVGRAQDKSKWKKISSPCAQSSLQAIADETLDVTSESQSEPLASLHVLKE